MSLMSEDEWLNHDATALAELVRRRQVKPAELLDMALARIARLEPQINAISRLDEAGARAQIDAGVADGIFTGVPWLLKEVGLSMRGEPVSYNSRFFAGYVGVADATLLVRYRKAGAVSLGRAASPELGLCPATEPADHGPVRNPWRLDRQTGGSSGGSAAAVAAGYVPMALGGDGGGSIRLPASHCGIYGLKPTRGRTPYGPVLGEGWGGFVSVHAMTRTVRDSAAALDATHGPAPGDPYAAPHFAGSYREAMRVAPKGLRIALLTKTASGANVHAEVEAAVMATAQTLQSLGHAVDPFELPFDEEVAFRDLWTIIAANAAASVEAWTLETGRQPGPQDLEPITWAMVDAARGASAPAYAAASRRAHALGRAMGEIFQRFDVILSPVFSAPPGPLGCFSMQTPSLDAYLEECRVGMPFTWWFNMAGNPAASLPLAVSSEGTPIGVQIACDVGRDDLVLALSAVLEEAMPWAQRKPVL